MELEQLKNLINESKVLSETYQDSSQKLFDITLQYNRALIQTEKSRTTLNQDENSLHKTIYYFDVDEDDQIVKTKLAYIENESDINEALSIFNTEIVGLKNAVKNYETAANEYELASLFFQLKNLQLEKEYRVSAFGHSAGIIYDRLIKMKYNFVVIALEGTTKRLGLLLDDILSEDGEHMKIEPIIHEHKAKVKKGDIKSALIDIIKDPSNNIDLKEDTKDIIKKVSPLLIKNGLDVKHGTIRTYIQQLKGDQSE